MNLTGKSASTEGENDGKSWDMLEASGKLEQAAPSRLVLFQI